jgi:anaerobic ribonucleoside-triphosphate reductase activating protein
MLKYLNSDVVFQEVPDEVALAVNLSGCPCRCPGCHSPYLWGDVGEPLTTRALDRLIADCHSNITCLALMGGDADPAAVNSLMHHIRNNHKRLHTAWYSGRSLLSPAADLNNFDYIKLGPYLAHLGPLNSKHTNQRFYRVDDGRLVDITSRFWRKP